MDSSRRCMLYERFASTRCTLQCSMDQAILPSSTPRFIRTSSRARDYRLPPIPCASDRPLDGSALEPLLSLPGPRMLHLSHVPFSLVRSDIIAMNPSLTPFISEKTVALVTPYSTWRASCPSVCITMISTLSILPFAPSKRRLRPFSILT